MFKKLFNKPKDKNDPQDKPSTREKPGQHSPSNGFEEIPERPFDINLDELWEYEFEELHEFIKHYEQFSNYMRNKYNDLLNEFLFVQEKLGLLEKERRRLVTESEQNKVQIENLKRFLDEKSHQSPNSSGNSTTKSSPQKTEETIQSSLETDQSDDETIQSLRNRAEKLLAELRMAEEPICHNIIAFMAEHGNGGHHAVQAEGDRGKDNNDESEGNPGSRRFDTDNNEGLDSERVNVDGATGRESKEGFETILREAVSGSLGQALKRIGKEVGNIFEGYSEVYGKTKQKEKEMIAKIKSDAVNKSKSEEYEKELRDVKAKLNETKTNLNETKAELDSKTKLLEKTKKIAEDNLAVMEDEKKQYEEALIDQQKEIDELHGVVDGLKEEVRKDEKAIEELEGERDELLDKLEAVEKEYSLLTKNKDKAEKDSNQELIKYQKNIQTLEEEKKKMEKKLQRNDADKLDIENSLIQEKLKHHQTIADLTKAKEKIEEVQKNLNEETEARKADMRKYEEFKKRMIELEKKDKENKKTIKNLNEQIEMKRKELRHFEEERNKILSHSNTNADQGLQYSEVEHAVHPEVLEKAEVINNQLAKIHQLEEKLELTVKELQILLKNSQQLQKDKDELTIQVKVLKEKRELGLQEIKRLTKLTDQSKPYDHNMSLPSAPSRNNIDLAERSTSYFSPVTIKSPQSVASSRISFDSEDAKCLRKIKKGLDEVYREIIMTITNEKIHESKSDRKATGKFGELVKGPLPSDNFMKIEKQMNDTIVLLQEFMENFE